MSKRVRKSRLQVVGAVSLIFIRNKSSPENQQESVYLGEFIDVVRTRMLLVHLFVCRSESESTRSVKLILGFVSGVELSVRQIRQVQFASSCDTVVELRLLSELYTT